MKRIFLSILVMLIIISMVFPLYGCGKEAKSAAEPEIAEPEVKPEKPVVTEQAKKQAEPINEPYTGPYNPLTGMPVDEDISQNRPYAVMINDIKAALPQHGVSQADIIYEAQVEGGITRMLAVYQDISSVDAIGSVRSARHYYIDLAQGLDAVYVHAGGSPMAYDTLWGRGIDNVDGVNGTGETFFRDPDRRASMGYEHSLMLDPSLINAFTEKNNIRTLHEDGYECNLKFEDDDKLILSGGKADNITVQLSAAKDTIFEYNVSDKLYYISQYGSEYMDGGNDKQVTAKNVIVIYTDVYAISGDSAGRLDTILTGGGSGYFACNGEYVNITWEKGDCDSQFEYKLENGEPVTFGRGTSYVCIIANGNGVSFE